MVGPGWVQHVHRGSADRSPAPRPRAARAQEHWTESSVRVDLVRSPPCSTWWDFEAHLVLGSTLSEIIPNENETESHEC